MIHTKQTVYTPDLDNKKMKVVREFDAPVEKVWRAWTEPQLLDQWWAPKPYRAETKRMDFREGGEWLYTMVGPEGDEQYCKATYSRIVSLKTYEGDDMFCDENGNENAEMPKMNWKVDFHPTGNGTRVEVIVSFASAEDMNRIIEMGFQQGFEAAHGNLDELLEREF